MKILIGIVFRGGSDFIEPCVQSIIDNTLCSFDLILIGFECEKMSDKLKKFNHEIYTERRSVSKNWNKIIQNYKKYDLIAILNDDILLPKIGWQNKCWLTVLSEYLENNRNTAVVSPNWSNIELEDFKHLNWDVNFEVEDGMQGMCFVVKSSVIEQLINKYGYCFDEKYICQWEDVDFLYRVHSLNYESKILKFLNIFHYGSKTINSMPHKFIDENYKNGMNLFFSKNNIKPSNFWTVHNSIYMFKDRENEKFNKFGY